MSKYLIEYDKYQHMVFKNQEDLIQFIAKGAMDGISFAIYKLESPAIEEYLQIIKSISNETKFHRNNIRDKLIKELDHFKDTLINLKSIVSHIPKNNNAIKLFELQVNDIETQIENKTQELLDYV